MKVSAIRIYGLILILAAAFANVDAQSRRSAASTIDAEGTILSVIAARTTESKEPIKVENIFLYENGIEQKINGSVF